MVGQQKKKTKQKQNKTKQNKKPIMDKYVKDDCLNTAILDVQGQQYLDGKKDTGSTLDC